jgi:molybdate transport system substrate-binding protein
MVVWQGVRLFAVGATTAQDKTITVFAAASLTNALDDVDTAFTKQSGIKVVVSYGASSALAKQIEQGAPMDVFASADLQWMDYCARKKVDTRVNLLGNKLVLIAAKDARIVHVTIGPGFDLPNLPEMAVLQQAMYAKFRSGFMPRPRWNGSAHGQQSSQKWTWPKMFA